MEDEKEKILFLAGAVLFVLSIILVACGANFWIYFATCLVAYLILGLEVLKEAVEKIMKKDFFNEDFLMAIATIAAFAIGSPLEAVGVMLFFRVGEGFEDIAISRSKSRIAEAIDMRPNTVLKVLGGAGGEEEIPADSAKVGDILLVRPGDMVPLDGVIVSGETRIDTSPITGEPMTVSATIGDEVISGSINTNNSFQMRVTKPLGDSMVSKIVDSVKLATKRKPEVQKFITKFSKIYTPIVIGLTVIVAIVPSLFTGEWSYWLYTAVSFLVMSCPCALVVSVPLAFFSGIGTGSKLGILFKGGSTIEALSKIKAIAFDKTGTITRGTFAFEYVLIENSSLGMSENDIIQVAASVEKQSSHPIAISIVEEAKKRGIELFTPESVKEIPGEGLVAIVNGHKIIIGNNKLLEREGVEFGIGPAPDILMAIDLTFVAQIGIKDVIKPEAEKVVRRLGKDGYKTMLLTGDNYDNANDVAAEVGIEKTFARLLPTEKLEKIEAARGHYGPVMFVGDGINDAPVLAGADVSVAMGSGSDIAIEAADIVLLNNNLTSITKAFDISKRTNIIAYENIGFSLLMKLIVIIMGFAGAANMWAAVFADTGVTILCVLNALRAMRIGKSDKKFII